MRYSVWMCKYTGFGIPDTWRFMPVAYIAGAAAGATTAVLYAALGRRPAALWQRNAANSAVTLPAAALIVYLWGPATGCILEDAVSSAYVAVVGSLSSGLFLIPWSWDQADLLNMRVSTAY